MLQNPIKSFMVQEVSYPGPSNRLAYVRKYYALALPAIFQPHRLTLA